MRDAGASGVRFRIGHARATADRRFITPARVVATCVEPPGHIVRHV